MILLIFPLLLHFSSADPLSDHLNKNVDVDVNPCDNFYLHTCSQSVNPKQFPFAKISTFYESIQKQFKNISISRNLAILNDIAIVQETTQDDKPQFDHSVFKDLIIERCGEVDECYRNEFNFFVNLYYETDEHNDRLEYFANNLEIKSNEDILNVLTTMIDSIYSNVQFNETDIATEVKDFYAALTNRLFVMERLKEQGIFDTIPNLVEDIKSFKELVLEKFRDTPWMNEKDELGLSLISEFEDQINDLVVYYDLDENDRDLELLRNINSNFLQNYYTAKQRSTGIEVLDILFALLDANRLLNLISDPEEAILIKRVKNSLEANAFYDPDLNKVAILAPFMYPKLTDDDTFDRPYDVFQTIGHEVFHSVILDSWADRSSVFKGEMECYNDHFIHSCSLYGEKSCNSGAHTFEEDGPDIEGLRVAYDFFVKYYNATELKEVIFESDSLSVTRDQAFFYLYTIFRCEKINPREFHIDVHSPSQVRVNGDMTQLPEFAKAFSCTPDQKMFAIQDRTCNLFGPNSYREAKESKEDQDNDDEDDEDEDEDEGTTVEGKTTEGTSDGDSSDEVTQATNIDH